MAVIGQHPIARFTLCQSRLGLPSQIKFDPQAQGVLDSAGQAAHLAAAL